MFFPKNQTDYLGLPGRGETEADSFAGDGMSEVKPVGKQQLG